MTLTSSARKTWITKITIPYTSRVASAAQAAPF
jgi:hypothetical protein